jgi:hypothetical protein
MKKKQEIINALILLFFVVILANCTVKAPDPQYMIPDIDYSTLTSTGKILKIVEVKGGIKTDPLGKPTIGNEEFQEALISTLKKSELFKDVFTVGNSDYELSTEIVAQKWHPGFSITSSLFVKYSLIETKSNKEIWKENIYSQYLAEFKEASEGGRRATKANEGAVRENLKLLLRKLSDIFKNQTQ